MNRKTGLRTDEDKQNISSVIADAVIEGKQGEQTAEAEVEKTEAEAAEDAENA